MSSERRITPNMALAAQAMPASPASPSAPLDAPVSSWTASSTFSAPAASHRQQARQLVDQAALDVAVLQHRARARRSRRSPARKSEKSP